MQALTFVFAFVAVLALIGVVAWLVRRFAGNRLGANTNRGRMPRLAVIDAAAVDGRRRLVLVRRDNVEHLLMIGGPTDIVVEPNIVRAMPGREQLPQRPGVSVEPPPRVAPLPDAVWADSDGPNFEHAEPQMPEPPPRPIRPVFADEARRPVLAERRNEPLRNEPFRSEPVRNEAARGDPLAGFAAEPPPGNPLGGRPEPRVEPVPMPVRAAQRSEPVMPPPAAPERSAEGAASDSRRRASRRSAPQLRRCRPPTRTWPKWRSAWKPRFAGPPGKPPNHGSAQRRRLRPNRRLPAPPAASRRRPRRQPRPRRAALKISKTRWRRCWAAQRPLREIGRLPA